MVFLDEDTLEFKRQMVHLLNGSAIAAAVYFLKPVFGLWILAPLILALVLLYLTPRMLPDLRLANHLMYHFERRRDMLTFPFKGAIMYGLGIIPAIVLLDVRYGCAVILVLSVGDAFSNLAGRRYGKHMVGRRSIEGSVGFFLTASAASAVLVGLDGIVLSLVGALVELFIPWDDNIMIPCCLSVLCLILGWGV